MTVGQALHTADQEQAHQMHHQYAQAQDALYSRDIEVQAVLDGALPAQAGAAPDEGPDEGTAKGPGGAAAAEPRSSPSPPPSHGSGGPAGRPPLERASVLSGTETRSVGSVTETEEGVQVTQPQGEPGSSLHARLEGRDCGRARRASADRCCPRQRARAAA
jgi:hypothetical protein